jgi:hypothetical protein
LMSIGRYAPMRSEASGKLRSNDRIALGPRGWRRGAQGFGAARVSALRQLTSRRLSERSGRRPRSEFGAGPKARAPQSSRPQADRHRRVPLSLVTFFRGSERKLLPCRGHIPTRPHASEHGNDKAGLRYLSRTASTAADPTMRTSKKLP